MYMNTQANLDYWSTDNCCVLISLRSGTIIIGLLSLIWQSVVVAVTVLALMHCPEPPMSSHAAITTTIAKDLDTTADANETYTQDASNYTLDASNYTEDMNECRWVPTPDMEAFSMHDENTLFMLVGIMMAYSIAYWFLSACVIVGVLKKAPRLLQGWVAFTSIYMFLTMGDLLVTLPFTNLAHLLSCITVFVVSLYTWAVVKSYMHCLKVFRIKVLPLDTEHTDYTVNGVDLQQEPVEV